VVASDGRATVEPSACGCGNRGPRQLVYALGQLGYDFGTEARRDSIKQSMGPNLNPDSPAQFLKYLDSNPWDAAAIYWTLSLDATPIYAVRPTGPFALEAYKRLRDFLGSRSARRGRSESRSPALSRGR
jgi:hypothetical protein